MHETPIDIDSLDQLLERSYEDAGSHLKSIITPQRRLDAVEVVKRLVGMRLLALATVTADGWRRVEDDELATRFESIASDVFARSEVVAPTARPDGDAS